MVKKSIGQFMAALRKANGMTQKQLAEKLNVSDKAISRWERDECAPDLSLIPVIAEVFGVTSDEILRGERRLQSSDNPDLTSTGKSEKQIERLVNDTQTKFSIRSTISVGISFLGLLAAMICNFGFNRAYIGFFTGCILYLAAFVCETIFTRLAWSSVQSSDFECEKVNSCKEKMFRVACLTYAVTVILIAVSLPLILVPWDTYMGITSNTWFADGLNYGMIAIVICVLLIWGANQMAIRQGLFVLTEKQKVEYEKKNHLKKCTLFILLIVFAVTFIGQNILNSVVSAATFSEGTGFTDMDAFKEYMETPSEYMDYGDSTAVYYDENDNIISEEEALTDYIYAKDGTEAIQYIHRNEDVVQISVDWEEDQPIVTTYTSRDLRVGYGVLDGINGCFVVLYLVEIVGGVLVYYIKKKKL